MFNVVHSAKAHLGKFIIVKFIIVINILCVHVPACYFWICEVLYNGDPFRFVHPFVILIHQHFFVFGRRWPD